MKMIELSERQETALVECLKALDEGTPLEECLARFPEHRQALREHLRLREGLLRVELPEPSAGAYESGRQELLRRVAEPERRTDFAGVRWGRPLLVALGIRWSGTKEWIAGAFASWRSIESPALRALAAAAVVLFVVGGTIGASAAAGFKPSRDVLSVLGIMGDDGGERDGPKDGVPDKPEDGAPGEDDSVKPPASERDGDDEPEKDATPTPEEEKEPEATPTKPAEAGDVIDKPVRDEEPKPTPTPQRDERPRDVEPEPTRPRDGEPEPTPRPEEPEPTKTPKPEEPEPTKTPKPEEPEPTKTPVPDEPI